jgi:hypothetical protein
MMIYTQSLSIFACLFMAFVLGEPCQNRKGQKLEDCIEEKYTGWSSGTIRSLGSICSKLTDEQLDFFIEKLRTEDIKPYMHLSERCIRNLAKKDVGLLAKVLAPLATAEDKDKKKFFNREFVCQSRQIFKDQDFADDLKKHCEDKKRDKELKEHKAEIQQLKAEAQEMKNQQKAQAAAKGNAATPSMSLDLQKVSAIAVLAGLLLFL